MRRKEPTLTPMLFGKASDKTRRRLWVLRHAALAIYHVVLPGRPFVRRAASKFNTMPLVTLSNLTELMPAGRPETENQLLQPKSSYRGPWSFEK
jgi:hypothetical protein